MGLRIFPVVGEALNFGGRRMATTARIAWLPVVLVLIVNMASVFVYLSVILGRVITFADARTYLIAQNALGQMWARGWRDQPEAMAAITAGNFILIALLTASFMAPLVRLSGLGEKPAPGLIRMAFGPDQLRFIAAGLLSFLFVALLIVAPILLTSNYALNYIADALSQTMASFPDPDSLHTIELVTVGESLAESAEWIVNLALPLGVIAPFALLIWFIAFAHFHPRNRPYAPDEGKPIARALVALIGVIIISGGAYFFAREGIVNLLTVARGVGGALLPDVSQAPQGAVLFMGVAAYLLMLYFNLRLYPYPGVAVCRKSMGFGTTLRVSRGWNIVRLQVILLAISIAFFVVQILIINIGALKIFVPWVTGLLEEAVAVTTRLLNSGVTSDWVRPLFVWIRNGVNLFLQIIWLFFYFGVVASLYGILYRESEREEEIPPEALEPAIWERRT